MIELQSVSKAYRVAGETTPVLKGISLSIEPGEFVSIMGPSGSGKSTLMHILGCLDTPTSGDYILRGKSVGTRSTLELAHLRSAEIGFVFQNFYLLPRMSALRNVELPMIYAGVPARVRKERALGLLERVGLRDRVQYMPNELSGGQKQRVAIARSLANQPSLLLADEPTGALDSTTGKEIMHLLTSLNSEGMTVILITHDPDVASYARRLIRIMDGQIVSDTSLQTEEAGH